MNITSVQRLDTDFVLSEMFDNQYSIVFDGSSFDENSSSCIIPVKSCREVELLLLSLGEEASVIMDEHARMLHPHAWDWLYGRTYSEIFTDLKWSYREVDEVIDIIERIPLPKTLHDNFYKTIHNNDPEPERINQEYVHKINKGNVLISKPYRCGNMFYFNGLKESSEFNIDHSSDHLEGIIIFEAARQASIASAHLNKIPFSGAIVILKAITQYTKFVECHAPYLIRTIPGVKQKGGYSFVVYNIIQNGHSCAKGYVTGMVYKTKEAYTKFRNAKFLAKTANEKEVDMQHFSNEVIAK